METIEIKGKTLEYIDETHTYIYDGIVLPSITQVLKVKFGGKYKGIPKSVLNKAADKGTAVHKAIENYEKFGIETDLPELRNYKFLKRRYGFNCIGNEVSVVLFKGDKAVAAGRLDLVLTENGRTGLADIKRTSALDKNYLAYQLNLYRKAYQQCYGIEISFLKGIHLREDTRKYIDLPVDERWADEIINQYLEENDK